VHALIASTVGPLRCLVLHPKNKHIWLFAGVNDAGSLLGRAGFTLPAVDTDTITYYFPDALTLMHSLQVHATCELASLAKGCEDCLPALLLACTQL